MLPFAYPRILAEYISIAPGDSSRMGAVQLMYKFDGE